MNCYLIDNNGFILVSEDYMQVSDEFLTTPRMYTWVSRNETDHGQYLEGNRRIHTALSSSLQGCLSCLAPLQAPRKLYPPSGGIGEGWQSPRPSSNGLNVLLYESLTSELPGPRKDFLPFWATVKVCTCTHVSFEALFVIFCCLEFSANITWGSG